MSIPELPSDPTLDAIEGVEVLAMVRLSGVRLVAARDTATVRRRISHIVHDVGRTRARPTTEVPR